MILVTGSSGLIGTALREELEHHGVATRAFDIARSVTEDTRNEQAVANAVDGVEGVVHLAAVSRVVWAQRDFHLTEAVNVEALRSLLRLLTRAKARPWVIFASSREVYGEQAVLPVQEDAELAPMNIYARSKVMGETLITEAREAGITANIARFSNVYGSTADHADRVVPAFAQAAALGGRLRLDGPENMFDFTHVDDVARGLALHIEATRSGEKLPPIHFLTGVGTTLRRLAAIAIRNADHPPEIEIAPSRSYDVARFTGDPSRARALLGWGAGIDIETGFARLARDYGESACGIAGPAAAAAGR